MVLSTYSTSHRYHFLLNVFYTWGFLGLTDVKKLQRPKITKGITYKKVTGCGGIYVTIASSSEGTKPIEVFAILGKNGGCARCQNESLTRCITLGLKYGIPASEYVKQLKGVRCPSPSLYPEGAEVLSCSDAIAKSLESYINGNNKDT